MHTLSHLRCAICLASDQNYIGYTFVTAASIAQYAASHNTYELVILGLGLSEHDKFPFLALNSDYFTIRFIDMENYIQKYKIENFFTSGHISPAAYLRYCIPDIFSDYDRVLYMDGDVIAVEDISEIFSHNIDNNLLGVVRGASTHNCSDEWKNYIKNTLKSDWKYYFCSGIILYNIKKCIEFDLQQKCFETQSRIINPRMHDQDVLNSVTYGQNSFMTTRWHFMTWEYNDNRLKLMREKSPEYYKKYIDASKNPSLIHYGGSKKPWHYPEQPFAHLWWKSARNTPFYERFLSELCKFQTTTALKKHVSLLTEKQDKALAAIKTELQTMKEKEKIARSTSLRATVLSAKRSSLKYRHALYRLLSKVTGGRLRKKFLTKRQEIKAQLDFLKRCAR